MDDRKLQVMLATLRSGSFGKAALELNCSQPAVTQQISSMENELGCKIFLRTHNGVQLTPEGEVLLPFIIEAEAGLTRLMKQGEMIAKGGVLPIRLAAFASVSTTLLPNLLKEYESEHPEITFDLRVGTNIINDWIRNGEIDIALAGSRQCEGFRWYPVLEDPYLAVLPEQMAENGIQKIGQEELKKYPFIRGPLNEYVDFAGSAPVKSMSVSSDDNNALLSMIAQGLGISVLPALSLQNLPSGVRVLELDPPLKRVLGVGVSNSPGQAVKSFAEFLRKRMQGTYDALNSLKLSK